MLNPVDLKNIQNSIDAGTYEKKEAVKLLSSYKIMYMIVNNVSEWITTQEVNTLLREALSDGLEKDLYEKGRLIFSSLTNLVDRSSGEGYLSTPYEQAIDNKNLEVGKKKTTKRTKN